MLLFQKVPFHSSAAGLHWHIFPLHHYHYTLGSAFKTAVWRPAVPFALIMAVAIRAMHRTPTPTISSFFTANSSSTWWKNAQRSVLSIMSNINHVKRGTLEGFHTAIPKTIISKHYSIAENSLTIAILDTILRLPSGNSTSYPETNAPSTNTSFSYDRLRM